MTIEGFPFSMRQEVVLRDLDAFGHVNNAVFLTYAENARVAYLRQVVGARRREEIRNIMASVTIDFRGQVSYGDALEIGVRVERIGTKSMTMRYRMVGPDGKPVAEATSVQVMFDFEANESIAVPQEWRQSIEVHDGSR